MESQPKFKKKNGKLQVQRETVSGERGGELCSGTANVFCNPPHTCGEYTREHSCTHVCPHTQRNQGCTKQSIHVE